MLHSSGVGMTARGSREGYDLQGKLHWFLVHILKEASKLHLLLLKNAFLSSLFSFVLIGIIIRDLVKKTVHGYSFFIRFCSFVVSAAFDYYRKLGSK